MGRKSSSGKRKGRSGGKYYKHIYFESKAPGRDSVFAAVKDIGKKGVNTPEELLHIAGAQLADLADLKTKDHKGKVKKWVHSPKEAKGRDDVVSWGGRVHVLWQVFRYLKEKGKLRGKKEKEVARIIRMIGNSGHRIMEIKSRSERVKRIKQVLKKAGFTDKQISELLKSTNK